MVRYHVERNALSLLEYRKETKHWIVTTSSPVVDLPALDLKARGLPDSLGWVWKCGWLADGSFLFCFVLRQGLKV